MAGRGVWDESAGYSCLPGVPHSGPRTPVTLPPPSRPLDPPEKIGVRRPIPALLDELVYECMTTKNSLSLDR